MPAPEENCRQHRLSDAHNHHIDNGGQNMTEAQALRDYLTARRQTGADRSAIDQTIFSRFGRQQAVMFTDLVGFSRLSLIHI